MRGIARCGVACLLLVHATTLVAQIPDARVLSSLDSALARIRMTRSDLAMHWDAYPDDAYRLTAVKHFFGDPLSTFSYADNLSKALREAAGTSKDLMSVVAAPLDIAHGDYSVLARRLPPAELLSRYGIRTEKFPLPVRAAITELLSGIAAADTLVRQARAAFTTEELRFLVDVADSLLRESADNKDASLVELKRQEVEGDSVSQAVLALAGKWQRDLLLQATALTLQSINLAKTQLARLSAIERDTFQSVCIHTPAGDVAIGGAGHDTYDGRYLCIVDLGGDDVYRQPFSRKSAVLALPVNVILDCSGNDVYSGDDFSFGCGLFGVSILEDMTGDDAYRAGSFGLGAGLFGVGLLIDHQGNDRYTGGTFVEGAGGFGAGLLFDFEGNDTYEAALHAQGFGFTWGLGAIVEEAGNDIYAAAGTFTDVLRYDDHFETLSQGCGLGIRPFASGGIGLIAEAKGNDTYLSDIYGQGSGYWYAFGAIVDDSGNDRYMSYQYAQGAGIHLAFGVLLDKDGTDYYNAHGVSMGCGHDIGFGGLLDVHGEDYYATEGLSIGGGNANAISFFCDESGDDGYIAKASNTFGYSDNRRGYGMIGVFLDLGGKDVYPTSNEKENTTWTGSSYGVGMDMKFVDTAAAAKKARRQSDDSAHAARDLANDIRMLFLQASAAPQKYQYLVEPARKVIIERKQEAIPYLLTRLSATSPRERLALTEMLPKMGDDILKVIVDSIFSKEERTVNMSLFVLGKMVDSADAGCVLPLLNSASWRVRANAAEQLGLMKSIVADSALRDKLILDTIDVVRMRAAGALGALHSEAGAVALSAALRDHSQLVRYKAKEALDSTGEGGLDQALGVFPESSGFAREFLAEIIAGHSDSKRVIAALPCMLSDSSLTIRGIALGALERRADKRDIRLVKRCLKSETDEGLLKRLEVLAGSYKKRGK